MEELLQKLVAFKTVTGDHIAAHEALGFIANFVAERGLHVERFESNGYESLVATTRKGYKTPKVMLAAHLDVVPAPDELFTVREAGGKFYGRGVLDMQFAIAAYLQVIDELDEDLSKYDLGLMITTDEEHGGQDGVGMLAQKGYRPNVCVLPDGGDNWQIQLSSKGFLYLKVATTGTIAHGSRPWLGDNAILKLTEVLRHIHALFPSAAPEHNTLNIGKIEGGQTVNQVAAHAEALLDIRVVSEAAKIHLLEQIEQICAKYQAELTIQMDGAATAFDLNDPFIQPFARLITEVTGTTVHGSHTLGSNDARYFAPHNIPCISLYPTGSGHHGPDEWLDQQAFHQFKEILLRYVQEIAQRASSAGLLTEAA